MTLLTLILHFIISQQDIMSRTKRSEPQKPKFDTKPYQKPGINESDILEIKDAFDMFDR